MKRWLICLCTSFTLIGTVHAQEDIQAMLKQIAKLEIYIVDLEKGYSIAKEGLTTIGEIKNGEFNLHSLFFSSLQKVNPTVARYSKIAEIIVDQVSIVSRFKNLLAQINNSGKINAREISYINAVYSNITNECNKSLNTLIAVTTDGILEMTDDERIKRIDGIYDDMKDKYAFTMDFTNKSGSLIDRRINETRESEFLKSLE
jgi:hypothetical protein